MIIKRHRKLFFTLGLFFPFSIYAQFSSPQVVDIEEPEITSINTGDLDNDGDLDIVCSSFNSGIIWYESIDGGDAFNDEVILLPHAQGPPFANVVDMNGDNSLDILTGNGDIDTGELFWYENDSSADFDIGDGIISDFLIITSVISGDFDGDGDPDILASGDFDGQAFWYENIDGQGTFGIEQLVTNDETNGLSFATADLDGDDDLDIIASSNAPNPVIWFENTDGLGTFTSRTIEESLSIGSSIIRVIDFDQDGDIDILVPFDNALWWYENIDGQGNFSAKQQILGLEEGESIVDFSVGDIDNDNNLDVVGLQLSSNDLFWIENLDGNENFGNPNIIESEGGNNLHLADIDNDGDIDIIAELANESIVWYENTTILGLEEQSQKGISIFPNPANTSIQLDLKPTVQIRQLEIYTIAGELIQNIVQPKTAIIVDNFRSGVYIIRLYDNAGNIFEEKFVKI